MSGSRSTRSGSGSRDRDRGKKGCRLILVKEAAPAPIKSKVRLARTSYRPRCRSPPPAIASGARCLAEEYRLVGGKLTPGTPAPAGASARWQRRAGNPALASSSDCQVVSFATQYVSQAAKAANSRDVGGRAPASRAGHQQWRAAAWSSSIVRPRKRQRTVQRAVHCVAGRVNNQQIEVAPRQQGGWKWGDRVEQSSAPSGNGQSGCVVAK